MRKCPQCGNSYTDETLRFCLADGAALQYLSAEEPTVISGRRDAIRVDLSQAEQQQTPSAEPPGKRGSAFPKILLILLIIGVLAGIVVLAAAGIIYYVSSDIVRGPSATPTPSMVSSPTPDAEKERLQNELANLQKKLDERAASPANKKPFPGSNDDDNDGLDDAIMAKVNSPGDGFLALRSEPSSQYGERLAQIPHGSMLEVVSCEPKEVTIGTRRGKWCLVEWRGRAGWVFDAWLDYQRAKR